MERLGRGREGRRRRKEAEAGRDLGHQVSRIGHHVDYGFNSALSERKYEMSDAPWPPPAVATPAPSPSREKGVGSCSKGRGSRNRAAEHR